MVSQHIEVLPIEQVSSGGTVVTFTSALRVLFDTNRRSCHAIHDSHLTEYITPVDMYIQDKIDRFQSHYCHILPVEPFDHLVAVLNVHLNSHLEKSLHKSLFQILSSQGALLVCFTYLPRMTQTYHAVIQLFTPSDISCC
jgi:hypothetical protein